MIWDKLACQMSSIIGCRLQPSTFTFFYASGYCHHQIIAIIPVSALEYCHQHIVQSIKVLFPPNEQVSFFLISVPILMKIGHVHNLCFSS